MNLKKKIIFLSVAVIILAISIKFFPYHCNSTACLQKTAQTKTVLLKNIPIEVTVVETQAERRQGLSGKDGLKEYEGMFFIFDKPDRYGFWMKEMKFSIDIVWIKDGSVVDIKKSVSPITYPEIFYPQEAANMVIELSSGFCDTHNVSVGDSFSVKS